VVIGENVRVDEGAKISPYSVIADNVVVSAGATVERSVVAEGTYIGEGAELVGTLVGRNSYVQARARLLERSALGDDVIVGEGATIAPEVKVYPHKTIESGANVTQSLIYETMGLRTVFKRGVVSGKFNVDLTPEFVTRLSSSFGTTLDPGAVVTLGRDASLSAQVAKRAMTAALLGTGINVRDLRAAHAGVVRHDVLAGKSSAGAHLRAGGDPDDVEILFFSSDATPITEGDERSIEKAFVREEYRRAHGGDIGELIYPGRVLEQFVERLDRAVDREKTTGATIVVDFCGGVAGLVASRVFSRLGVSAVVMEGFANANAVGEAGGIDPEESIERVARIVPTVNAAFGAVVGPEAEYVQFVDDEGELVPPDVMLACLIDRMRPQKAVFPINLSREYENLVAEHGGRVSMSRTGLGNVAIEAASVGADLASLADGRYIFPSFLPSPDCFMTIAGALEVFRETPLSGVRQKFGASFGHVVQERLECPWSAKGRVMRGLAERFGRDPDAILAEGVLLGVDGGWVLMLPDPDSPLFYVYAETGGDSPADLMEEYVELVKSLIEDQAMLSS
jgi:mannose-1-phosphate guanylyltransferase / phosphomannomutase